MRFKQGIYLDNHASTPCDPRVGERMTRSLLENFGNPDSRDHAFGDVSAEEVARAAREIADLVDCAETEIVFTSGATESINLALQGFFRQRDGKKSKIAVSPVEHMAVLDTCRELDRTNRAEIVWLRVDVLGRLDLDSVRRACREGVSLMCCMAAGNEVGNIYPIQELRMIAEEFETPFFCDATQAVGKIPFSFEDSGAVLSSFSAHKIYGPKGCGALLIRDGFKLKPLIHGGGHQRGMRSGTLNVAGIVGLGEACRLRKIEMEADESKISQMRNRLQNLLLEGIPNLSVNGDQTARLAGNLHVSIPDVPNGAVISRIRSRLAISTGAACSSGAETPSHVLRAMQLPMELIAGALRMCVGKFNTMDEMDTAADILVQAVEETRTALKSI